MESKHRAQNIKNSQQWVEKVEIFWENCLQTLLFHMQAYWRVYDLAFFYLYCIHTTFCCKTIEISMLIILFIFNVIITSCKNISLHDFLVYTVCSDSLRNYHSLALLTYAIFLPSWKRIVCTHNLCNIMIYGKSFSCCCFRNDCTCLFMRNISLGHCFA